jgi:hypothetical protein
MRTVENWIWRANLRSFVDVLAWLSGYELSEGEREAIYLGAEESDSDANPPRWYNYEFSGRHKVKFQIGHDKGTEVVQVRLQLSNTIVEKVEVAVDLMNQYTFGKAAHS